MPSRERMPPLAAEVMTAEQKKAADEFKARPRLRNDRAVLGDAALARGDAARQGAWATTYGFVMCCPGA